MDLAILSGHRVKIKEREKIYKYLDLARVLKNYCETCASDDDTRCSLAAVNSPQINGKGTGNIGNMRINQEFSVYIIADIRQNTQNSLIARGDLLSLSLQ